MIVRHRGHDEPFGPDDVSHLLTGGHAASAMHPWDWSDEINEALADELDEVMARKRPVGFAPWPETGRTA